jgi:hypothetical protein
MEKKPIKKNSQFFSGVAGKGGSGTLGRFTTSILSVDIILILFLALVVGTPLIEYSFQVKDQFVDLNLTVIDGQQKYGCYDGNIRVACSVPLEYNFREVGTSMLGGLLSFLNMVQDTTDWVSGFATDIINFFDDGLAWDPSQLKVTNSQVSASEYFMTVMTYQERIYYRDVWLPSQQFYSLYYTYNQLNVI